jgi:asparagine synthase (glutamine-hydrolysing)
MCGIYGAASSQLIEEDNAEKLKVLGGALRHRGPDGNSEIRGDRFQLGFNRLAIVDIERGMQPFQNADGQVIVTANGEIYNYLELRQELINYGIKLKTSCDIEVIPHLYQIYGDDFVSKIRGMFAIAVLDKQSDELKVFVDRIGEKPLYWMAKDGVFFYSSEMIPLLESKIADMRLDLNQVSSFLRFGFVPDPCTMLKDVFRVTPGTFLTFSLSDASLKQTRYWSTSLTHKPLSNPVSSMRGNLETIAKTICQGDAKVGIALSSGLDSKIVAELARSSGIGLQAISIGYTERSRHDETEKAAKVAKAFGMNHHIKRISAEEAARSFKNVCASLDEPVSDIASISYFALFQASRELNVRVLLMGHGSDELFMGYPWLNKAVDRAKVRSETLAGRFKFSSYVRLLELSVKLSQIRRASIVYYDATENLFTCKQMFRDLRDAISNVNKIDLFELSPAQSVKLRYAKKLHVNSIFPITPDRSFYSSLPTDQIWQVARHQLITDYLRVNGLLQIDKLSMSQSIEVRNPLVDYKFAETIFRVGWYHKEISSKAMLKAAKGIELSKIGKIENKVGFSPPTRLWYRSIKAQYFAELSSPRSIEIGLFPKNWRRLFVTPFRWNRLKSPVWFELVMMEMWIRETEKKTGLRFLPVH